MHSRKAANRCEALDELDHRADLHIGILTGAGGGPMRLVPQRIAMEEYRVQRLRVNPCPGLTLPRGRR